MLLEAESLSDTQSLKVDAPQDAVPQDAAPRRTRHMRRPGREAIVLACVLLLILCGIAAAAEFNRVQDEQERLEAAEAALTTPQSVEVVLGITQTEATSAMPVAIRVAGTTQKGSPVDETQVVTCAEPWLSLAPGSYAVSLVGNAISSDGLLYRGSIDRFEITVSPGVGWQNGAKPQIASEEGAGSEDDARRDPVRPVFAFVAEAPESVTDADVEAVRSSLDAAGIESGPYADAAYARRTEAQDRIRAEGEARDAEQLQIAQEIYWLADQKLADLARAKEEGQKKSNAGDGTAQDTNKTNEEDRQ